MRDRSYIVGIAGGSGSGKTTFLKALFEAFEPHQLALVSQDNYYFPKEEQAKDENGWENFDLPTSIDSKRFHNDLVKLSSGQDIEKLEYTFNNASKAPKRIVIPSAPVIITEGLFVFHYPEIAKMIDYRVYLEADEETRLNRRIARDGTERGYPENEVRYQWANHVIPAERLYLEPYQVESHLVIDNTESFDSGLDLLKQHIQSILPHE
jgi:uridine kinase